MIRRRSRDRGWQATGGDVMLAANVGSFFERIMVWVIRMEGGEKKTSGMLLK